MNIRPDSAMYKSLIRRRDDSIRDRRVEVSRMQELPKSRLDLYRGASALGQGAALAIVVMIQQR